MSFSLFTRRYWGNHSYFLFLRLLICLSSAGHLAWFQVLKKNIIKALLWIFRHNEITKNLVTTSLDCWFSAFMFNERIYDSIALRWWILKHTETNMLSVKTALLAFKDLMLEEFCNSHCVSHFAAFFIVMGTKISIVENFLSILYLVIWEV